MRVGKDEGLEVRGPIVFKRYFNNPTATQRAFTPDGWFNTGDNATTTRRSIKGPIIVNGVKHLPHELETAIEQAKIPGLGRSSFICLPCRPNGSSTEHLQNLYLREYDAHDVQSWKKALDSILHIVVLFAGARPHVLPLSPGRLERSTLGKLSLAKARTSL